jgi:glutathione S-transferase
MIKVTAFTWVPDFAKGLVRELRVRWALEEASLPYEEILLEQGDQNADQYRDTMQPFAQIPVLEESGLRVFESGAIVLYVAERSPVLLPRAPAARARAVSWMFAALNSVEPHVQNLALIDLFHSGEAWARLRRPGAEDMVRNRLAALERRLGGREYLEDSFTAGDLLMTTVLRGLRHTDLVSEFAAVKAYQARCEARPAFMRALTDHLAAFDKAA